MKSWHFFLPVLLFVFSCGTPQVDEDEFDTQILNSALWMASNEELPGEDSLLYGDHPAPIFRKTFMIDKSVKNADLIITAAGYYTVWINGEIIGDQVLAPAWTDYSKRIYLRKFEVSDLLVAGTNVICIELGNGWYNPLPLRMWGHLNLREHLTVGQPRALAGLNIQYSRFNSDQIVTDTSWKWYPGPIIRNSIYLGEWYNSKKEPLGWKTAEYDDKDWMAVTTLSSPGGDLQEGFFPPIRKTAELNPVSGWWLDENSVLIDFGQNMAGGIAYEGKVVDGDTLMFRFGERIWPDSTLNPMTAVAGQIKRPGAGGPGAPNIAEQIDVFIPSGSHDSFEPRYTFHGFRYVEISGINGISLDEFMSGMTAYRLGTDVAKIGEIDSDLGWLNEIQKMVEWTLTSNIFSVPSDCPAREKFGYGGDISQNAEVFLYNYDVKEFLLKFVYDWKDAIRSDKFVDTAPFVGINYCGISWEGSFLLLQDWIYRFYGDLELVKELYEYDLGWIEKVINLSGIDLVRKGLSDHESLLPVPVELTGSGHYYQLLRIMEKFSNLMDEDSNSSRFNELANQVKQIMIDSLWINPIKPIVNKQTWYSTLLFHEILPPEDEKKAVSLLLEDLENRNFQLTTGIFGTPYLLEVLSKHGHVQEVFDMISRTEFPGWRFMLDNGATTLWETWKESDNTFSQNHPMFGAVSTWFHRWLGGIDPIDEGFAEMVLRPAPVKGLDNFSASRIFGENQIKVSWENSAEEIVFSIYLPDGVRARWEPLFLTQDQLLNITYPDGNKKESDFNSIIFDGEGLYSIRYEQ